MKDKNVYRLLDGPYTPPTLQVGDRMRRFYRNVEVVITSWTGARIPRPRGRAVSASGRPGLLRTDELVRAIRTESAEAIKFWFAVSTPTVWHWRRGFGISQWGTEGSRRLHRRCSEAGAARRRPQNNRHPMTPVLLPALSVFSAFAQELPKRSGFHSIEHRLHRQSCKKAADLEERDSQDPPALPARPHSPARVTGRRGQGSHPCSSTRESHGGRNPPARAAPQTGAPL
jgi:hypothetical protein